MQALIIPQLIARWFTNILFSIWLAGSMLVKKKYLLKKSGTNWIPHSNLITKRFDARKVLFFFYFCNECRWNVYFLLLLAYEILMKTQMAWNRMMSQIHRHFQALSPPSVERKIIKLSSAGASRLFFRRTLEIITLFFHFQRIMNGFFSLWIFHLAIV